MVTQERTINEEALQDFLGKAVGDVSAAVTCANIVAGEKLGLYQAMAGAGPMSAGALAEKTGTNGRLIQEWLNNQAAAGYLTYDEAREEYGLPDEHAAVLADEESPAFIAGIYEVLAAVWRADEALVKGFRDGSGLAWHQQDPRLFPGTESFFRTSYRSFLTSSWIPALDGVEAKLREGAKVADVGCGHGASTIIMAQAFPQSEFFGFDYHEASIDTARARAVDAGLGERLAFETSAADAFPGSDYSLVCFFDALHDMADPVGVARHARETLEPDGTVLLVEPMANDLLKDNLNPVGAMMYGISTFICTANGVHQGGEVLGAQAGEGRMKEIFTQAGFTRFRRATETPFNLVFEAKP